MFDVAAVAVPLTLLAVLVSSVHTLSARWLPPPRGAAERACATAVIVPFVVIGIVALLGEVGALMPWCIGITLTVLAITSPLIAGRAARETARSDATRAIGVTTELVREIEGVPFVVGLTGLALAAWAASLLQPWSWDGLGYHLPVVYDALQEHRLREIPSSVRFVNAYPHAGEFFMTAWRSALPNDRWIDFAQAPFALSAVVTAAGMAVRAGASPHRALGLTTLFLAVPITALQLASNYVDVVYGSVLLSAAYFATGPLEAIDVSMAGLSLGLLAAVKPSAPPAVAILFGTMLVLARAKNVSRGALVAAVVFVVIGSSTYLRNTFEHHNPVWPVEIHLGPWRLPGLAPSSVYIDAGVPEPYLHRGWIGRLIGSWFALRQPYVYDMRIGGFGPLFVFGLVPLSLAALALRASRRGAIASYVAIAATLATPGAFLSRYTLAIPAALLAWIAITTERTARIVRAGIAIGFGALAAWGLWAASLGFTHDGPSLRTVQRMSAADRVRVASIDGHGLDWSRALGSLRDGEATAFDDSFELSGLLWRGDGRTRVVFLPDTITDPASLRAWLSARRVGLAVLGDRRSGIAARRDPAHFVPLFVCRFEPCNVYRVNDDR